MNPPRKQLILVATAYAAVVLFAGDVIVQRHLLYLRNPDETQ